MVTDGHWQQKGLYRPPNPVLPLPIPDSSAQPSAQRKTPKPLRPGRLCWSGAEGSRTLDLIIANRPGTAFLSRQGRFLAQNWTETDTESGMEWSDTGLVLSRAVMHSIPHDEA